MHILIININLTENMEYQQISCISCNIPSSHNKPNMILYNSLYYCKSCYDQMLSILMQYHYNNEKQRKKIYVPPVHIIDNIYIGNIDSVDTNNLKKLNITDIIICGKNLKNNIHNNFECLEFLIDDSFEQEILDCIKQSNQYIDSKKDKNILIHCYSGISRSGSFVIGYIMYKLKISYEEAFLYVKNIYPKVMPNENFIKQLKTINF